MPCMFGLAAVAEPLVKVLLTDKWLPCVPFLQLSCISFVFYPIHNANLTAINSLGRSDVFLKLEIIKKIITIVNLFVTIPFGVYAMAIGQVIQSIISTFINSNSDDSTNPVLVQNYAWSYLKIMLIGLIPFS